MGRDGDPMSEDYRHKVNLPRPFWMARLQTTKRLYDTFRKVANLSGEERLYGGMDIPAGGLSRGDMVAFCEFLTRANAGRIPKGYVFRLPTDAEWEYALNANSDDPGDPYVRFREGDGAVAGEISVTAGFVNAHRVENGLSGTNSGQGAVFRGGTRRPNAWGIFDMLGNGGEALLDTIPGGIDCQYGEGSIDHSFDFGHRDGETEPDLPDPAQQRRWRKICWNWRSGRMQWASRIIGESNASGEDPEEILRRYAEKDAVLRFFVFERPEYLAAERKRQETTGDARAEAETEFRLKLRRYLAARTRMLAASAQ